MSCTCTTVRGQRPACRGWASADVFGPDADPWRPAGQRAAHGADEAVASHRVPVATLCAGRKFMPGEPMKLPTKVARAARTAVGR